MGILNSLVAKYKGCSWIRVSLHENSDRHGPEIIISAIDRRADRNYTNNPPVYIQYIKPRFPSITLSIKINKGGEESGSERNVATNFARF